VRGEPSRPTFWTSAADGLGLRLSRPADEGKRAIGTELTDELVAAAAAGDRDASGAVYAALAPRIFGFLRARGVDDPEGLTSEVFLQLLPRLGAVTGGAEGVRKLAFTIARARAVDALRSHARSVPVVPYEPEADVRTAASAEDAAEASFSLARVHAVLDLLPDDQRDVLILRVVADLTVEQVAAIIGRSPGAVKQLQRRGLVAIRRAVEERRVTL
jgi:RNA polymerase sigma-70 factor (ECF subfamily)